jgi:hypothetical protein
MPAPAIDHLDGQITSGLAEPQFCPVLSHEGEDYLVFDEGQNWLLSCDISIWQLFSTYNG